MSRKVTLSDTFDETFQELLVTAMRLARNGRHDIDADLAYVEASSRFYEYDTKFESLVSKALNMVLTEHG